VFRFSQVTRAVPELLGGVAISDGSLSAGGVTQRNVVPLPVDATGGVLLSLALQDGTTLEISASECSLSATDDGRFVETLPEDLDPTPA
jgi:hypothetical protein